MLRNKLAQLLTYLLEHRDRPVSKEELLDTLWQHGDYRERSLTQSIRELRQALGESAATPHYIRTLPQRGYQWIAETRREQPRLRQPTKNWPVAKLIVIATFATVLLSVFWWSSGRKVLPDSEVHPVPTLLVLPFTNETGDPALDWLELGYADMLAKSVAQSPHLRVVPPSAATQMLASSGVVWPSLPQYVRGLLREQNLELALIASVRIHNRKQVLDFHLMDDEGLVRQGSITYPSLSDATADVAKQLLHLIAPKAPSDSPAMALPGDSPEAQLARRVLAEGISALQKQGPARADELFQAADLLVKNDPWVTACRAKSQLLTGQWREAREKLEQLQKQSNPESLQAFVEYWSAQLAFRRGQLAQSQQHLQRAMALSEQTRNVEIRADSYRLRAHIAWQQMQWRDYEKWREKANRILPQNTNLSIEADRLFYFGNPVGQGLDTYPSAEPSRSADLIERALQFYTELDYQPMIAASELALARNESLPLKRRTEWLESAIDRYRALRQPYELTQALIYASYFYLQRHRGEVAEQRIDEASQAASQLGDSHRLTHTLGFYRAFSLLDQGLDQTHRGLHGADPEKLEQATTAFEPLLNAPNSPVTRANALVLQGWGLAALGKTDAALANYQRAMKLSKDLSLQTNFGYAVYSAMAVYLHRGDYQSVLALGNEAVSTRQQLAYLARAQYELGKFAAAADTLTQIKQYFPSQWTAEDDKRLAQYRQATDGEAPTLVKELPAYAIYCESDWKVALN